jgi:exopolyphosphatase / guanosine-5'-triphosphate,3'-diphosphate pyrophosphatase
LAAPIHIAAIDAGSNAIRLLIARATSTDQWEEVESQRATVRLGHNAFTRRAISNQTIARAARTFREFRRMMDRHHVSVYRAVATSAAREARNRQSLIDRIRRKSGIELEVISGEEEARLVSSAVLWSVRGLFAPRVVFDLGGGSLELNFFRAGKLERRIPLPLGTVRLMETYRLDGAIDEDTAEKLRMHTLALLRSAMPSPPDLSGAIAVACGGNAECLASLAAGPRMKGVPAINVQLLRERMWQILPLDVPGRMKAFHVRQDRAEVMGIAAVVLHTLGRWLNLRTMLAPAVGVREGLVLDQVAAQYLPVSVITQEEKKKADGLIAAARWFGRRLDYDAKHADQVCSLSLSLFDQLRPLHGMSLELRLVLELGALLHDVGHFVNNKAHHRHGDYLVRNGEIPGLRGWRRDMVALLIRYHNAKSEPQLDHKPYAGLDGARRKNLRQLCALLRIAEKLESDHHQGVSGVDVSIDAGVACFRVHSKNGMRLNLVGVARKAALFEREFHLEAAFRRAQTKMKVA